jgi:hypothetical protein
MVATLRPDYPLWAFALRLGFSENLDLKTENYFFPPLACAVTIAISAAMA